MASFIVFAGFVAFLASVSVFLVMLYIYGGFIPGLTGPIVDWHTDISSVTGTAWIDVLKHARTAVFASVVTFELLFVWNCRDEYKPIWRTTIRKSKVLMAAVSLSAVLTLATIYFPPLAVLFQTMPLNLSDWALIIATCIPALLIPSHILFGHKKEKKKQD
jgi:magnesium-transporting ATPase (P-type)